MSDLGPLMGDLTYVRLRRRDQSCFLGRKPHGDEGFFFFCSCQFWCFINISTHGNVKSCIGLVYEEK